MVSKCIYNKADAILSKFTDLFLTVQCPAFTLLADGEDVYYGGGDEDFEEFGEHIADGGTVHTVTGYENEVEQYADSAYRAADNRGKTLELKPI